MDRLKISTRLTFSFMAMMALILVLGTVALWGSSTQRSVLTDITQRQIPIIRILNTITDGANEQAIQFRNLAIFSTEKIQTSARATIQKTRAEVAAEMDLLHQHIQSDQGKSLLNDLKLRRTAFLKSGDEFLGLIEQGQRDEALALLETQLRPHQLEYQKAIRGVLDRQTQNAEVASQKAESAADNLFKEVLLTGAIAIVLAVVLAITITRSITRPLSQAVAVADRVAGGDLSGQITVKSQDETGQLLSALQRMQQSLVNTVTAVRSNAQGVASGSAQIAVGNSDLSGRTEEQASALEQTAASMEQLGATVKQNADNARQANQMAMNASSVAAQGGEVVAEVVETMKSIDESSNKIADIISVIDGIAFQTNILALNAAVEAARAGEQGRGFAVVASEVRALAGRSAEAAKEIKQLITTSVERVEQGSLLVDRAGKTMTDVVTAIRRVTDIMGEISAASHEQSSGMAQIGEAVTQMDQTTQQNAALVEEMAAAASSLNNQAQSLVEAVAVFKLSAHEQAVRAEVRAAPVSATRPLKAATAAGSLQKASAAIKAPALHRPAAIAGTQQPGVKGDDEWETF
ncbi:MAG: methyl-accepting chemotaxis protein [Comamonas sp.]|jgi:methyl-accepting chemotaxis protein|uniref:methyl-accepting chemotaxis protein n=1 Tax=Comamonas sp. TaxID=34028 RepID=UPI00281A1E9D|nr:methyl-accepting chemotaxis protein [Comamonas sp.]MDR0215201.1 methyl-accepting chemotaxis protein [Comamonas sp.]